MRNLCTTLFAATLLSWGCAAEPVTPGADEAPVDGLKPEPLLGARCDTDAQCDAGEECMRPVCITTPCDFPGTCALKTNYQDNTLVAIPDNDARGITRIIHVPAHGRTVESLNITIRITHTYRGDLVVSLTSPSGHAVTLSNREGGGARDLLVDLAGDRRFAGEPADGDWTLRVADLAARDVGTLQSWRLVFGFGAADDPATDVWARVSATPEIESPHPYANNTSRTWDLSGSPGVPGSKRVRVHFRRLSTERGYDFVEILGAGDAVVQRLTGPLGEVTSSIVEGDHVKVRLRSDGSVTDFGFAIDSVEVFGHGCLEPDDCGPGYTCALNRRLCLVYPCFQECIPQAAPEPCYTGGCSGQVCSDHPGVISTCEFFPWYQCFQQTACERQGDGTCAWTPTPAFLACMAHMGRGAADGEACGDARYCNDGLWCDRDGGSSGVCRQVGACDDSADCSADGNAWAHVLCVGSASCAAGRCAWSCGEPACREGDTRPQDCNTCSCSGGRWICTSRPCPPIHGVGETCGGFGSIRCADGLLCDYGVVTGGGDACQIADRGGICIEPVSGACSAFGGEVCGCNGQTFANDCQRRGLAPWGADGRCRYGQSIPDNSATGVTVTIAAAGRVATTHARVRVDIAHPYRGDLVVTLTAPDGRVFTLTNRAGGSADDYHFDGVLDLSGSALGTWTLRVTDRAAADVGTLAFFNVIPT